MVRNNQLTILLYHSAKDMLNPRALLILKGPEKSVSSKIFSVSITISHHLYSTDSHP